MATDPLSDILALLEARGMLTVRMVTGGAWSLAFQPFEGIKFNALARGHCWLIVQDEAPVRIDAGDCFLLMGGRPFVIASDPSLTPVPAAPIFAASAEHACTHFGSGEDVYFIGGRLDIDQADAALLLDALPSTLVMHARSDTAGIIRWLLQRLVVELEGTLPGQTMAGTSLLQLMFVEVLRAYAQSEGAQSLGWLAALGDQRIGQALQAIHGQPDGEWTLMGLAAQAGMSRSSFAQKFKDMVGVAPLEYLLNWRMRLAAKRLRTGTAPVGSIALSLGYESESGFSSAFKRVMGVPPLHYRQQRRTANAS